MTTSKSEKAIRGVSDLFLGRVVTKMLLFFLLIAYVRLLSLEELAILPLYYTASAASTLLFSFGIPATLLREVPRYRVSDLDKMHSLLFTGLSIVMGGVILTAIMAVVLRAPVEELFFQDFKGMGVIRWIILGMVIGGWRNILNISLKALQKYRELAIYRTTYELLQKTFGLIGYLGGGLEGLLIGFLLGGMIPNLWCLWDMAEEFFVVKKLFPLGDLLKMSWPFYFEGYIQYFRSQGDVLIVSALLGTTSLAMFYLAKRLYELLLIFISSIEEVIAPTLSQLLGESKEVAISGYSRMTLLIPLALIPMGLFVVGLSYMFLDILGGIEYANQAYMASALFCIAAVFWGLFAIQSRAVFVFNRSIDRFKLTLSQFVVYIPSLYFLVSYYGIVGAPLAQIVSLVVASTYAKYLISHIIRTSNFPWAVVVSSLIGLSVFVGLQMIYYSIFAVFLYAIVTVITFVCSISLLFSNQSLAYIEEALPPKFKRPFSIYMEVRNKLLAI